MKTIKAETRYGAMLVPAADICVGRSLVEYGEWTQAEIDVLAQMIRPGMTVLDIGANVGYHTLAFSKMVGATGTVVSFEPQPRIFQLLAANIANNDLQNVTALNMAVGESRGYVDMPSFTYDDPKNYGTFSARDRLIGEQAEARYLPVPVQRLDDMAYARAANVIKMDVEGMELSALAGAAGILKNRRPLMFIENDKLDLSEKLIRFLDDTGYDCYWQLARLFKANNFKHSPVNLFENQACINMLVVPKELTINIKGMPKIVDFSEHPFRMDQETFKSRFQVQSV